MTQKQTAIRNKLLTGMQVSYNDLIAKKQRENGELYFVRNGKVVEVKASDLNPIDIKIPYPRPK